MKNLVSFLLVAVCSVQVAAFAQPVSGAKPGSVNEQQDGVQQNANTNMPSSTTATEQSGPSPGTEVRGSGQSASTSDKETSRTWSGVGSTGGGTGTGDSSGVAEDPPPSKPNPSKTPPTQQ